MYIESKEENFDFDAVAQIVSKIFGVVSVSIAYKIKSDYDLITKCCNDYLEELLSKNNYTTFKVDTRRGDKKFPMDSPEVCKELGGFILSKFPQLKVDIYHPDFIFHIEIRENTYFYTDIICGVGGMPVGSNGKAMLLLSGGIDSPVAGYMISKRGVILEAVHFYSYPYTSERSKEKVIELSRILSKYTGKLILHIVPFTDIQVHINEICPAEYLTIIIRRAMMRIAENIACNSQALALISGESVGQVASQTLESLYATNEVVNMPVLRPLIGMDKNEVIEIARKIGTFETSILPYEDCCTVFIAKHPVTRPTLASVIEHESKLDLVDLINIAINNTDVLKIEKN
jgi:thiamine biosynthesis protein ThiI